MAQYLLYRPPPHVHLIKAPFKSEQTKSETRPPNPDRGKSISSLRIPEKLSFDRVIAGKTCVPCSTRDFMDYLTHIEHVQENLQFLLWFRDYTKRFADLPGSEKALSPDWRLAQTRSRLESRDNKSPKPNGFEIATFFKHTGLATAPDALMKGEVKCTEFDESPTPTDSQQPSIPLWSDSVTSASKIPRTNHTTLVANAYEAAGVTFQPFTCQPYREEITRIIALYIANGGSRQLNLTSRERESALRALAITTHPSGLEDVYQIVQWSLRHQAHPNFIRWTAYNANPVRVAFLRVTGVVWIIMGLITAVVLTVSSEKRRWRVLSAIPLLAGMILGMAGWRGMCPVMQGLGVRQLRPWEGAEEGDDDGASNIGLRPMSAGAYGIPNPLEEEPWVARYKKRNLIRRLFDRQVQVNEPELRKIQKGLLLQSTLGSVLLTTIIVGIFCAIPPGYKI